jgi:preprotein translocase subunit YajC
MIFNNILFLQATGGGSSIVSLIFPLLMIAVFFIFIFLPQMRRQKKQATFLKELTAGKEVYTNAGIIGRIVKVDDKEATLLIDEKTKIRVVKSTIAGLYSEG